jgi:hypothetical protein
MPRVHDDHLDGLIHRADLDGLIRLIDDSVADRDWARLTRLREGTRSAGTTGRQLWPAATLAEYRLALWAPARFAAAVLDEGSGRFTLGPLTEVVAQHHTFAELSPLLPAGPRLGLIAHERALRGEHIDPAEVPPVFDIPAAIQPWEPEYPLPVYSDDGVTADPPALPSSATFRVMQRSSEGAEPPTGREVSDVRLAVHQLLEPWATSSNGRIDVAGAGGCAADAVAALGVRTARFARLTTRQALAMLAWAGAGGGAHGRRRGGALGRFGAWWTVAALGGALGEWPLDPAEVGEIAAELRWWWWDADEPSSGWELQLAAEDPAENIAWAVSAHDAD